MQSAIQAPPSTLPTIGASSLQQYKQINLPMTRRIDSDKGSYWLNVTMSHHQYLKIKKKLGLKCYK